MSDPPRDPPAEREGAEPEQTSRGERTLDAGPRPRGLVGLLVWPLQALLLAMVSLAAGLVQGLVRALIPGAHQAPGDAPPRSAPPEEDDPEPR